MSRQLATSPTKKRRINSHTDIGIQLSKRPRIDNTPSDTSHNGNSGNIDEETSDSTDNGSDWEKSQGSKPRAIVKPAKKSTTKKRARKTLEESDTELQDPKFKINFRDCPCKISTAVKNKLVLCRKRAKNDSKQIIKDIELVTAEVLANMCWNHVREFCSGIGLKPKIGGRDQLTQRLEVIRTNRFSLGNFIQSPKYGKWFRQSHRGLSEEDALGSLKFQPIASLHHGIMIRTKYY